MEQWDKEPATVRYVGETTESIIHGKLYKALFIEYWEAEREKLIVLDETGWINNWYLLEDYEIIEDKDNVLNLYSAKVRCITHEYSRERIVCPEYGEVCEAIAVSSDGYYLVHAGSHNYYYSPEDFEVLEDSHGVLLHRLPFLRYGSDD